MPYGLIDMGLDRFYLILHPRPAYVIGSGRVGVDANYMAASWVTPVAEEPPLVGVAVDVESHTYSLIDKYKEFTVNVLSIDDLDLIYEVGHTHGWEVDKLEILPGVKGEKVRAPIPEKAIAALECRVYDSIEAEDVVFYAGEVLKAWVDPERFHLKRGWSIKNNPIPLHNWGKGFFHVGRFRTV